MNAGKLEREEEADEEEMEEKKVKKEVKGKVEEKVVVTEGEEGGRMVEEEEDTARGTRDGSGRHRISLCDPLEIQPPWEHRITADFL